MFRNINERRTHISFFADAQMDTAQGYYDAEHVSNKLEEHEVRGLEN